MVGKRVSFVASMTNPSGTYAEFCVTEALQCIPIDNETKF